MTGLRRQDDFRGRQLVLSDIAFPIDADAEEAASPDADGAAVFDHPTTHLSLADAKGHKIPDGGRLVFGHG